MVVLGLRRDYDRRRVHLLDLPRLVGMVTREDWEGIVAGRLVVAPNLFYRQKRIAIRRGDQLQSSEPKPWAEAGLVRLGCHHQEVGH